MIIKRILAPLDFSNSSSAAIDYAIGLARTHKAELILVHIIEPMNYSVPRFYPKPTTLLEEQRQIAAAEMAGFEAEVKKRYRNTRSEIHFGVAYEMILHLAENLGADLIVLATHGHTGLAHALMGSVTEKVVRYSDCPVMTIRTVPRPHALKGKHRKSKAARATAG